MTYREAPDVTRRLVAGTRQRQRRWDVALRYCLAPACVLFAILLYLSPAGGLCPAWALLACAVFGASWAGGIGPGLLTVALGALALPHLTAANAPMPGGFFDLCRLLAFSAVGLAVGWWSLRHRRNEASIRASQRRVALAVAGSCEGIWDIDFVNGTVFCSERTRELCGLSPGPELVPLEGWFEALPLHPDDRPKRFAAMEAHLSGKTAVCESELRLLQLDGNYRWRRVHGLCVRDANGNPQHLAGSITDVDARRRAEDALRESEQRYEVAVNAGEDGFWDWLPASDEVYVSPRLREIYGFSPDASFTGRNDLMAQIPFHPDDRPRFLRGFADHLAGHTARHKVEGRILRTGETRWVQLSGFAARDPSGAVVRWTGMVRDITERRRADEQYRAMEQRLRQAQRLEAMGTLAGGIAHEFNNLLGTILGYGEMALRAAPQGSRLAQDLDSIMDAGERGRKLVERVLAFSRTDDGNQTPVYVERAVSDAIDLVAARLPAGIEIKVTLTAGRAAMLGAPEHVHQIVTNLMKNAIQAMPEGGTLRLDLRAERFDVERSATVGALRASEYIVLEIVDCGIGIAPGDLEHIFEPFFTTREVNVGSGLGLSLVHGIVINLGGAIDVMSTQGSGSTFTVYLPRSGEVTVGHEPAEHPSPRGHGQRILVVDEVDLLARLCADSVRSLGYQPMSLTSLAAAIEAFRADPDGFAAVIVEESLLRTSGTTLIRELRRLRADIPILLVSDYAGGIGAVRASSIGVDGVLKRPLSERDLAVSLARVLGVK